MFTEATIIFNLSSTNVQYIFSKDIKKSTIKRGRITVPEKPAAFEKFEKHDDFRSFQKLKIKRIYDARAV